MSRQPRHQTVVSRQSDASYSEDHWLKEFENKLQSTAVQPRGQSLYDQIHTIMNGKSKYPSVQAAVDDMMQRSGLTAYLDNVKTSEEETSGKSKKVAQQQFDDSTPEVIKMKPSILGTLENIIKETKGNIPVPAIIRRLRALHAADVSDENAWDEDKLIRLVSNYNLRAKTDNPSSYDNFSNLGKGDHSTADSDIDQSNTDAFNILMPAKI